MASKYKSTSHSKSKTPSPPLPTSPSHSKSPIHKREVEKNNTTPTAKILNTLDNSSPEPPEV